MGTKPWLKGGSLLCFAMLVCGCQDMARRDNDVRKTPPPQWPANQATGPGAGANFQNSQPGVGQPGVGQPSSGLPSGGQPSGAWNPNTPNNFNKTSQSGFGQPAGPSGIGTPTGFSSTIPPPTNPGLANQPGARNSGSDFATGTIPPVNNPASPGLPSGPAFNNVSTPTPINGLPSAQ